MNTVRFLMVQGIFLFFLACGGDVNPASLFSIVTEDNRTTFKQNESVSVTLSNKKNKELQNITYFIDGEPLDVVDDKITLDLPTLGNKVLKARIHYEGDSVEVSKKIKVLAPAAPRIYTYEIINTYPHDIKAYTQGLEFHGDTLYESTGKKGTSWLRKTDFQTGRVLEQIDLEDSFFGEGITILGGKIYQLTWRSGMGFVYDLKTMEKLNNFQYGASREGWGLTHDGKRIFKSDGTEKIWFLDPETLTEQGYIETVTNKSIFNKANELEYVDGK
ncbi:MAG: glutaminyl-peptide cyclotransferase, partial [Bacteroidota bacterium]